MSLPLTQSGGGGGSSFSGTPNQVVATDPSGVATSPAAVRALVAADVPTLNQNTTGTASNLSGTPALPNGVTATTQAVLSNDTKIATDAYVGRAVTEITVSPSYYVLPFGEGGWVPSSQGVVMDGTASRCRFVIFNLDRTAIFTKMTINITVSATGNHIYLGIYDAANTTLKGQWTVTLTASTGVYTATKVGGGSITLTPGAYMLVWASESTAPVISGWSTSASPVSGLLNANVTRLGQGAVGSPVSGGVLPANLGVLVAAGLATPAVFVEP